MTSVKLVYKERSPWVTDLSVKSESSALSTLRTRAQWFEVLKSTVKLPPENPPRRTSTRLEPESTSSIRMFESHESVWGHIFRIIICTKLSEKNWSNLFQRSQIRLWGPLRWRFHLNKDCLTKCHSKLSWPILCLIEPVNASASIARLHFNFSDL